MNIKIINAGNCMMCGREIKIVTNKENYKLSNILFCPRCEKKRMHQLNKRKEELENKLNTSVQKVIEEDIVRDVKCRLTVDIRDRRPCYCSAELREVWRESEDKG